MDQAGDLSPIVTFAEANRMPYLQACMKEAMRLHPAVGQLLERVVPAEGFEVAPGIHLPPGTTVGMNPWIPGRDKSVYGPDAEQFRPERWLEASEEALKLMDRNFLAVRHSRLVSNRFRELICDKFGAGARTCLGKNISLLEMSKLVPQVIRKYQLELSDPKAEWVLTDHWFVKQSNLFCRLNRRET
jgi:cytochrome P450